MLARENALRPLRPCVKSIYNLFVHPPAESYWYSLSMRGIIRPLSPM